MPVRVVCVKIFVLAVDELLMADDELTLDAHAHRSHGVDTMPSSAPSRLVPTRWLELAMPASELFFAGVMCLYAIQLFSLWQRLQNGSATEVPAAWLPRLDRTFAATIILTVLSSSLLTAWVVITAINARRITIFAPSSVPFALAWMVGPGLIIYGRVHGGEHRQIFVSIGVLVGAAVLVLSVAALRRVAQAVANNASPVTEVLVVLLLGGATSFWVSTRIASSTTTGYVFNSAMTAAVAVCFHVAYGFFMFRAARFARRGFSAHDRARRADRSIQVEPLDPSTALHPMDGARHAAVSSLMAISAGFIGLAIWIAARRRNGKGLDETDLHLVKVAAVYAGAVTLLAIVWWTMVAGRNAALLAGRRMPWATGIALCGWWLGVPAAAAVAAVDTLAHGLIAAAVAAMLAMIGHARLAGLARCTNMRYTVWALVVARSTAAVGGIVRFHEIAPGELTSIPSDTFWIGLIIGTTVTSLVLLAMVMHVGRSLARIDAAIRTRKDQLAFADPGQVLAMARGFFSAAA